MGNIALSREQLIFVVPETTSGQLKEPRGTDVIYITGDGSFTQQKTVHDNMEKRNSRTRFKGIAGKYPVGEWSYPTYFKPSGTAGTAPECADLWTAGFGTETANTATVVTTGIAVPLTTNFTVSNGGSVGTNTAILVNNEVTWVTSKTGSALTVYPPLNAAPADGDAVGASVNYTLAATNPGTVSQWFKLGHTVFSQSGCTVNTLVANVPGDGVANVEWGGQFMRQRWTGTDSLASNIDAATTNIKVNGSAKRFCNGSIFKIGSEIFQKTTDTASNAVATVAGLTRGYTAGTNISAAATHGTAGANGTITPWIPSSYSDPSGTPQPGYLGMSQFNGSDLIVQSISLNCNMNVKIIENEKDNNEYPTNIVCPNFREITGDISCLFRQANAQHYQESRELVTNQVIIPIGKQGASVTADAGNIASIQNQQVTLITPSLSGDEETIEAFTYNAYGSTSSDNDESRVAFL